MKSLILFFFLFFSIKAKTLQGREYFYSFQKKSEISLEELSSLLPPRAKIVLGEVHNVHRVQQAEGKIIAGLVRVKKASENFMVSWEFLNYQDQFVIDKILKEYFDGKVQGPDLLAQLFKGSAKNNHYLPLLKVLKREKGKLYGLNAPRTLKKKMIERGLKALRPEEIPPNMSLGGRNYYERFEIGMRDHVPSEKVDAYFLAQSYVDSIMSYWFDAWSFYRLNFMIVGHFHSDYNDGVVRQLLRPNENKGVTTIKIVDMTGLSEEDRQAFFRPHRVYGELADFLYIIDADE